MNVTHNPSLPLECRKIFQRLFVFVDTKDPALNSRLQLIVNPEIIKILLKQVQNQHLLIKVNLLRELTHIFQVNSFNSQILAKRDRQIMEFNHSILQSIINFVFTIACQAGCTRPQKHQNSQDKQPIAKQKIKMKQLADLMTPFFTNYPANPKIIKNIISAVAKDFYSERVSHSILEVSLRMLQNLIRQQGVLQNVPNSYFLLYGEETGIKMLNKNIKWPFSKGFHLYLKFMIQDFPNQNMNLFTMAVEQDDFVLFITPDAQLKIKVFATAQPVTIASITKGQWITVALSYTIKNKLLRNFYQLLCKIDGEIHQRRDLPVPNISMGDQIVDMAVGHSFYGKLHTIILSRTEITVWNKLVINSWKDVQTLLMTNKKQLRDLFLFYHPLLMTSQNHKDIAYDITSLNQGQLLQNSAVQINPFLSVDVNYYGGLYTYLPFLHLLKFYQQSQYGEALTHILELFALFFQRGFIDVQLQAINCQFFRISCQLINEINPCFITRNSVLAIKQINRQIKDIMLKKQLFVYFLWKINIRNIPDTQIIEGILEIIEDYYIQSFEWSYALASIDTLFHYLIDHLETQNYNECCLYHYAQCTSSDQTVDVNIFKNNYTLKTNTIKRILKLLFTNIVNYESVLPLNTKIMQILFQRYSPCLKLLLLQSLNQGVKAKAQFYIRECNLLNYLYIYLGDAHLAEQIAVISQILLNCQQQDEDNKTLQTNIIHRLADTLDRLYTKKCQEGRSRCNSDRLQGVAGLRIIAERRSYSQNKQKGCRNYPRSQPEQHHHIGKSIESNKRLYQSIIKLCFFYDPAEEQYLLKHDDYVSVLQPYFKLCCLEFRKNIINMVRNTVILASAGKSIMANLTSFDKLYKLLLTEFVLKELQPNGPDYFPTETTNYIIRNVYFIVDYMVMGMRNDWIHLYIYLLRLIGLLEEARKQIKRKTDRTVQDIEFAVRICMRKFVLRVVKLAQKNIHNLPNLVFLVYLTVFSNASDHIQTGNIFRYFHSLEKDLFEGPYHLLSSEVIDPKDQTTFIDSKLILETVNSFKICNIDIRTTPRIKITNFIQGYLDLQYTTEDTEMYKSRLIYLITAQFKPIRGTDHSSLKEFISGFLGNNSVKDVSIGQTISIMLCLCIQSAISTQNQALLKQSTKMLQSFFLQLLLLCSRDGLKRECHNQRNSQLPRIISYNILHFLFDMLTNDCQGVYTTIIQQLLYNIFCFLGLLITCLYDKLGHPQNFDKGLELANILKHVQQYNFFSFQLMKPVLPLKDMIQIPNADRSKVIRLIYHEKVLYRFHEKCALSIQKKIQQATSIHKNNVVTIKRQIETYFTTYKNFDTLNSLSTYLINQAEFEKTFILQYLRDNNLQYRRTQRVWRKIWKRLRLYHYFWAISMNQRQTFDLPFKKNSFQAYRHKFSKFVDENGVRPILQVEPIQPWHVKKVLMQKQFEYRSSNYLYHLHHEIQLKKKQKSLLQKIINIKAADNTLVFYVDWIKNNSKRKGYLSIQNEKLKFKYVSTFQKDSHLQFTSFILAQHKPIEKYWPLIEITDIIQRRYLSKKQCLLIQFQDTTSLIFNFINDDKEDFLRLIESKQQEKSQKLPLMKLNHIAFYTKRFVHNAQTAIDEATMQWKQRKISNFHYLMLINKYAGRSYLDPANYPVFPWIIASYDFKQYLHRDLTKTIGALGSQQRIGFFKSKLQVIDPFDSVPPYQFGTHYSSPGVVFNFLVRLHPYTEASRTLQGGKFDLSDRLFNSIKVCWNSVISEVSDVRQLIPEFFYLPQFLLNIQQYNLGLTQQKERVHNVTLPIWSNNAYDYIVTNRRELQSDYVSDNLNHWIDLIFGYKQKGKLAEQNLNLFYYLTYENSIDLADIQDPQTKISKEAQIMHFGQTPSQIFSKPHITRNKLPKRRCFSYKKVSILLCLQSNRMVSLLRQQGNRLIFFHDYNVLFYQQHNTYSLQYQVKLLRNNSRQNIYFTEELDFSQRVHLFTNQKFILIASYVNGDLIIYSLPQGKKVQQKKGTPKNCVFVNQRQNLVFCGCKNGLLEIYEIVYGEKETMTLIKIAAQYYMAPITSITQGGNFYGVTSGNMVVVIKMSRSLAYIYDKTKMKGIKMIRSIESNKKIEGCLICCELLFCIVFYNALELQSYSVNGQLLKIRQIQMVLPPQKLKDDNFNQYVAVIEDKKLVIYSLPFLEPTRVISLPNKIFREMKFIDNKCYLITNFGEVLCLTESQIQEDED